VRILEPSTEELAAHLEYLAAVDREAKGRCVWLALERARAPGAAALSAAS
jgi:hypothetical protein